MSPAAVRRASCWDSCWHGRASTWSCWRSTPTSSETSGATPSTRPPSTWWTSWGCRPAFGGRPAHPAAHGWTAVVGSMRLHPIDFGRVRGANHEIALMPQWDLLDLLATEGRRYPGFRCGHGRGGHRRRPGGRPGHRCRGADRGRRAARGRRVQRWPRTAGTRRCATGSGCTRREKGGVPIDVLWLRLPRPTAPLLTRSPTSAPRRMVVTIPRPDYLPVRGADPQGGVRRHGGRAAGVPRAGSCRRHRRSPRWSTTWSTGTPSSC